jgi:hypothetical protein
MNLKKKKLRRKMRKQKRRLRLHHQHEQTSWRRGETMAWKMASSRTLRLKRRLWGHANDHQRMWMKKMFEILKMKQIWMTRTWDQRQKKKI